LLSIYNHQITMSHYIDKIFYINLDKRTDRREEIENELKNYELDAERYPAILNEASGIVGCSKSHLNVLKLAKERGYKNVLILEDDFEFIVSKEEFEDSLAQFFESGLDYDVVMLSYIVQKREPFNDLVSKIIESQTASGYIVNCNYYDTIIGLYEWSVPLLEQTNHHWLYANDFVWHSIQPQGKWYFFNKKLGKQRSSYSDNKMCFVEMND